MSTTTKALTPYEQACESAKARINAEGKTYGMVAKETGFPRWLVSRVLNGTVKAKYGRAHDCAVALGVKKPNKKAA